MSSFPPARRAITGLVSGVLLVTGADAVAGQTCTVLPQREQELWLGGSTSLGTEAGLSEGLFSFNVINRLTVSVATGWGGYDVEGTPTVSTARLGALFRRARTVVRGISR